jgi:F0F1-type ATP synthase assembly protein I
MVGQIGCVTAFAAIAIIAIAFGIGWFLDDLMGNERRIMTIIMLLASFPVTLFAMVRLSLFMLGRAQQQVEKTNHDNNKEETTP